MATDPRIKKPEVMPITGLGTPAGIPAPLPMMTANMAPPPPRVVAPVAAVGAQPPAGNPSQFLQQPGAGRGVVTPPAVQPAAAAPAPAAAPAAPLDAQAASDRAAASSVLSGVKDINNRAGAAIMDVATMVPRGLLGAYDTAVVRPARAAGVDMAYTSPLLLPNGADPASQTPYYDRIRAADAARAATPAGAAPAVVAPVAAAPARVTAATPAVSSPAVLAPQGSDATQPVSASEGVLTPAVTDQPGARAGLGGIQDTQEQLARIQANNANVERGGLSVIDNGGADRNAAFNDGAALRTAAAQGSWSPRRGFQGNEGAVQAALAPINARARLGEAQLGASTSLANTAAREAGDTARLGMREAGDTARAARTGAIDQQRLDLQRQDFGLRAEGARMDNATKARVEAVQNEIANAKTPEARRAGAEKLAALQGKAQQDQFAAIEVGGGSVADPTTGLAVAQPKSALIFNKATGSFEQVGGIGGGAAARPAIAEGSMSTSNGKPIKYVGGKWVPA